MRSLGLSEAKGSLEHHLHPAAQRPQRALGQARDLRAAQDDRSRRGILQSQDRLPDRGLAGPGFADQPQHLAAGQAERHVGHGLHGPAARRKPLPQAIDGQQRRQPGVHAPHHAANSAGPSSAQRMQRTWRSIGAVSRLGRGGGANRADMAAARREAAAGRRIGGVGRAARDRGQRPPAAPRRAEFRHRVQQALRIGMQWPFQHLRNRSLLDHLAGVHHHHAAGHLGHHPQVVGDEQDRQPALLLQPPQQVEDLGLNGHVQRRGRLVGDQQARIASERHGRSSHAGACRPTSRADRRGRGGPGRGCRPAPWRQRRGPKRRRVPRAGAGPRTPQSARPR